MYMSLDKFYVTLWEPDDTSFLRVLSKFFK